MIPVRVECGGRATAAEALLRLSPADSGAPHPARLGDDQHDAPAHGLPFHVAPEPRVVGVIAIVAEDEKTILRHGARVHVPKAGALRQTFVIGGSVSLNERDTVHDCPIIAELDGLAAQRDDTLHHAAADGSREHDDVSALHPVARADNEKVTLCHRRQHTVGSLRIPLKRRAQNDNEQNQRQARSSDEP